MVFAAYDPELDRKVALKLLHPRLKAAAGFGAAGGEGMVKLLAEVEAFLAEHGEAP